FLATHRNCPTERSDWSPVSSEHRFPCTGYMPVLRFYSHTESRRSRLAHKCRCKDCNRPLLLPTRTAHKQSVSNRKLPYQNHSKALDNDNRIPRNRRHSMSPGRDSSCHHNNMVATNSRSHRQESLPQRRPG